MRLKTKELMTLSWDFLLSNDYLNGFTDQAQFEEEWSQLGEVAGDGSDSYFTRINSDELFGPGNVVLINVEDKLDFELVTDPSINGGSI